MVVCHCNVVNDRTINQLAARMGVDLTVEDVTDHCGAGARCGGCLENIEAIITARLDEANGGS